MNHEQNRNPKHTKVAIDSYSELIVVPITSHFVFEASFNFSSELFYFTISSSYINILDAACSGVIVCPWCGVGLLY